MRAALLAALAAAALTGCSPEPQSALERQAAHARGNCGDLGPGTGLSWWPDGTARGEVTTMLPGVTEFRMRGPGKVGLTLARLTSFDMTPRAFVTIVVEGAAHDGSSVLEWKPAGVPTWSKVPTTFLYPRKVTQAQLDVDNAIRYGLPIPGVNRTADELRDPRRIVTPEERYALGTKLSREQDAQDNARQTPPPQPQRADDL